MKLRQSALFFLLTLSVAITLAYLLSQCFVHEYFAYVPSTSANPGGPENVAPEALTWQRSYHRQEFHDKLLQDAHDAKYRGSLTVLLLGITATYGLLVYLLSVYFPCLKAASETNAGISRRSVFFFLGSLFPVAHLLILYAGMVGHWVWHVFPVLRIGGILAWQVLLGLTVVAATVYDIFKKGKESAAASFPPRIN